MRYAKHRNRCDNCAQLEAQIAYANRLLEFYILREHESATAELRLARGTADYAQLEPKIPPGAVARGKTPRWMEEQRIKGTFQRAVRNAAKCAAVK